MTLTNDQFRQACKLMREHGVVGTIALDLRHNVFMVVQFRTGIEDVLPIYLNDNLIHR